MAMRRQRYAEAYPTAATSGEWEGLLADMPLSKVPDRCRSMLPLCDAVDTKDPKWADARAIRLCGNFSHGPECFGGISDREVHTMSATQASIFVVYQPGTGTIYGANVYSFCCLDDRVCQASAFQWAFNCLFSEAAWMIDQTEADRAEWESFAREDDVDVAMKAYIQVDPATDPVLNA